MSGLRLADDGGFQIAYSTEADLQNGVAELATLHGWRVQTEVVVPNWGRLDLVLHAREIDDYEVVIEFKLDLTTPSALRKAFQQADGYARWLALQGHARRVWLVPGECDWTAAADLAVAYAESVRLTDTGTVMRFIVGDYGWNLREPRSRSVAVAAASRSRMANAARAEMARHRVRSEREARQAVSRKNAEALR